MLGYPKQSYVLLVSHMRAGFVKNIVPGVLQNGFFCPSPAWVRGIFIYIYYGNLGWTTWDKSNNILGPLQFIIRVVDTEPIQTLSFTSGFPCSGTGFRDQFLACGLCLGKLWLPVYIGLCSLLRAVVCPVSSLLLHIEGKLMIPLVCSPFHLWIGQGGDFKFVTCRAKEVCLYFRICF